MFITYGASVVLISLAIYGILCLLYDLWEQFSRRSFRQQTGVSFLILIKDVEQDIEFLMYDLIHRLERTDYPCDAVIVDCGSNDLTYEIALRMTELSPSVEVLRMPGSIRPINEALPLCRGTVVHILDLISRMPAHSLISTVDRLLLPGGRQAAWSRD